MKSYKNQLENIILGTLLVETNAFSRINNVLRASCFNDKNKIVFEAIQKLFNSKKSIDIISVSRQILIDIDVGFENENKQYVKINQYLISISMSVCSTTNLEDQVLSLIEISLRENLIFELNLLIKQQNQTNLELFEDLIFARNKLFETDCEPLKILDNLIYYLEKKYPIESENYQSIIELSKEFNKYCVEINKNFNKNFKHESSENKVAVFAVKNEQEHWPEIDTHNKSSPTKNNNSQSNIQQFNNNDLPF